MNSILRFADRLSREEEAATIVEYTFLILFVAMACFAAVAALGTSLRGSFQSATTGLS